MIIIFPLKSFVEGNSVVYSMYRVFMKNLLGGRYQTDLKKGLTKARAVELLQKNGPNCLVASHTTSKFILLLEKLFSGYAAVVWVGAILSFVAYGLEAAIDTKAPLDNVYLGVMLVLTVFLTGFFEFYQDCVTTAIMESFKKLIPTFAKVIRDGEKITIPSEELVVGDLVEVKIGDLVPADLRVTHSKGMKVDHSSITGESEHQTRTTICTDKNPLETANLAFYSTHVVEGFGQGIVIACGDDTLIGHIAGLTSGIQKGHTPMKKETQKFIKVITIFSVIQALFIFILTISLGHTFFKSLTYFIAIVIGNIPLGLLITLTAALTLTAKRMQKKNCLVKNLQAIETLGSTTVICSDKTGTLTENQMKVAHLCYDAKTISTLDNYDDVKLTAGFENLARVAMLCNRAEFQPNQDDIPIDSRLCHGDASETAVLRIMEALVGNVKSFRRKCPKVVEIPFNSVNKYQVSIHKVNNENLLVIKGAPEIIVPRCATALHHGHNVIITEVRTEYEKAITDMAYMGERIIAFADLELDPFKYPLDFPFNTEKVNFPLIGLRLVGLMAMIDPPRLSVPEAIKKCRTAGVRVVMVTGDHPITGMSIAKKVGIITQEIENQPKLTLGAISAMSAIRFTKSCIISGMQLRKMSEEKLESILNTYSEIVFARTSPQQKLQIVEALQRLGEIVAVTGDGVNDSPALKKADVGIAMGITGTDVSKEAADVILLDDNFSSIVIGIEEGRLIYDNLKKSVAYALTPIVPEMMPFIIFALLDLPETLTVMVIIAINVGTDIWPSISLAHEKAEADIMMRMPRNQETDKLVNRRLILMAYGHIGMIQGVAVVTTYFFMMAIHGFFYDKLLFARTKWENKYVNDFTDSYGQEWTYEERMILSRKCYSAFFVCVVITQAADLLICKTRRLSLFQQGMSNWVLNCGIIFSTTMTAIIICCPGVNMLFKMHPVEWYVFIPALPFGLYIIVFDELRKYCIRKYPDGWVRRETYY